MVPNTMKLPSSANILPIPKGYQVFRTQRPGAVCDPCRGRTRDIIAHFYKRLMPLASVVTGIGGRKRWMPWALLVTSSEGFPPNLEFFPSRRDTRFSERNDQELSATPAGVVHALS
jgi:hypothetical protein